MSVAIRRRASRYHSRGMCWCAVRVNIVNELDGPDKRHEISKRTGMIPKRLRAGALQTALAVGTQNPRLVNGARSRRALCSPAKLTPYAPRQSGLSERAPLCTRGASRSCCARPQRSSPSHSKPKPSPTKGSSATGASTRHGHKGHRLFGEWEPRHALVSRVVPGAPEACDPLPWAPTWTNGKLGKALDFNGKHLLRRRARQPEPQPDLRSHCRGVGICRYVAGLRKVAGKSGQYVLGRENDEIWWIIEGISVLSFPLPSTGSWHHLAGTYSGSESAIYLDGVLIASEEGGPRRYPRQPTTSISGALPMR